MKIEQKLISFEKAEQLKNLGLKQDSSFYYVKSGDKIELVGIKILEFGSKEVDRDCYSAFCVTELGEKLSHVTNVSRANFIKAYQNLMDLPEEYYNDKMNIPEIVINLLTKPDYLADMIIYLLKNNLILGVK